MHPAIQDLTLDEETERVLAWREAELHRAGYPLELAHRLAALAHVDLHRATDLLRRGADPATAAAILE
jgi:hypothetical protein